MPSGEGGGASGRSSIRSSSDVTRSRRSESMPLNSAKASDLYSFSGSRWP